MEGQCELLDQTTRVQGRGRSIRPGRLAQQAAGRREVRIEQRMLPRRLLRETAGADAASAAVNARRLVEQLALALQASLLVRTAPPAVSDAFIATRLGGSRGHLYGVLPVGTDAKAILSRH